MLIAWRPVEKGELANPKTEILSALGVKYQKSPAQIAINWLISQPNVVTLSKTSNITHLKDNLGAVGWQMGQADIEFLRKNFPSKQKISNRLPLE